MYEKLAHIAKNDFNDIVTETRFFYRRAAVPVKLRLKIRDEGYVDIWLNKLADRYAYHWELRATHGLIFRHDNAPDHPEISTYPKHFHDGSEENVHSSKISSNPQKAIREFLNFVRKKLSEFEDE